MVNIKMDGIKEENGIVKLYNERVILFPPNIITLIGSVFGTGSESLLVYLGKTMGRNLVETWEEHLRPKNLRELTELFVDKSSYAGWGRFTIEKYSDKMIVIKLDHNISHSEESPLKHICHFIHGYLSGFGEYALYGAEVIEHKCSVEAEDPNGSCIFVIRRR